jgi:hypothetical protein
MEPIAAVSPNTRQNIVSRLAWIIPAVIVAAGAPTRPEWAHSIRAPLNIYDEGLYLTMAHFSSLKRLPYRDFWTLYGPGTSVMGLVVDIIFGRTVLAHRAANLVVLTLLVIGLFRLIRRYVGTGLALAVSSFFAIVPIPQFHMVRALALVVWGLHFMYPRPAPRPHRWLPLGTFLIGCSFLGRWDFVVLSIGFMGVAWLFLRGRIEKQVLLRAVVAGSLPALAFLVYLALFVPSSALYENFFRYPFTLYPKIGCRGSTMRWGPTFAALIAPFRGNFWSREDLVLIIGNLLAPLAAVVLLMSRGRGLKHRSVADLVIVGVGFFAIAVWVEMRSNYAYGSYPAPAVPLGLVAIFMLFPLVSRRKRQIKAGRWIFASILVLGTLIGWLHSLDSYRKWPSYRPLYGFTERSGFYASELIDPLTSVVDSLTKPGEPIFVALNNNSGHYANAPTLYWLLDHPPASRYFEFDPCLTDRNDIQSTIVRDLRNTNVVVTSTFFPAKPPFGVPAVVLDDYLSEHFRVYQELHFPRGPDNFDHRYSVLLRTFPG